MSDPPEHLLEEITHCFDRFKMLEPGRAPQRSVTKDAPRRGGGWRSPGAVQTLDGERGLNVDGCVGSVAVGVSRPKVIDREGLGQHTPVGDPSELIAAAKIAGDLEAADPRGAEAAEHLH